jgi:hypothetical protein
MKSRLTKEILKAVNSTGLSLNKEFKRELEKIEKWESIKLIEQVRNIPNNEDYSSEELYELINK